jgi:Spy/CpxP family protein refolding chaperone
MQMTELSRRRLLTAAAVASAATAMTPLAHSPARAAAPPVGKQNAGWYRYKVGSFDRVPERGVTAAASS